MCLKIIFTFVLTLTSLALSAEIMLRMEIDDSNANADPSDLVFNLIPKFSPPSFSECELSESTTDDNPIETIEETSTTEGRMSSENDNDESTLPMIINDELQLNADESTSVEKLEIGNNIRLDISENGYPMIDAVDKYRQVDNHEIGLHLVDPHTPPQNQLVDNTLRLQAIKSTVDDLATKIFPHLHMIQHLLDDHQAAH